MILQTIEPRHVKEIMEDAELFSRVSDDLCDYEHFMPPMDHAYVACVEDGVIMGFFWLHADTSTTMQIHANFLKAHRHRAQEGADKILDHVFNKIGVLKLIAKIPVTFPDVYYFTKRQGFADEGCDRKSILKGGKLIDRYCLGLTREDYLNGRS